MGIVAIFFPRAYGKANRVIPRKHRTINPVAPHVSFLPRVEVAQAARRIARATKPRNRSPISARYYKFESISLQRRESANHRFRGRSPRGIQSKELVL